MTLDQFDRYFQIIADWIAIPLMILASYGFAYLMGYLHGKRHKGLDQIKQFLNDTQP